MSFKLTLACRACGSKELVEVFNMGTMPLANDFKTLEENHAWFYPLSVKFCSVCRLAQLGCVVDPNVLYNNYCYRTSTSQTMRQHIKSIYGDICREISPSTCELGSVFEIGSNDGELLQQFKELGANVVTGMEPASNLAEIANHRGIRTLNKFFCKETIIHNAGLIGVPEVVLARHVFCHIDDWHDFIEALELICSKDTLVCIEVPYAGDTLARCEWDQIYFEHLSYLSIHSMEALLDKTDFHLHKIKRYPIHGGSILLMLRRNDCEGDLDPSISEFLDAEDTTITADTWRTMAEKAKDNMDHLYCLVEDMHNSGKTIAGMGASAKSTVWINASGIGKFLSFIADETPNKIGRMSPGSNIPILPESSLLEKKPDATIIFAWNFLDEIMQKHAAYKKAGGTWIVPVPEVSIC